MSTYDLVVIGGGSSGLPACEFAAAAGATVLLVEAEHVGGDCTWTGCVPSKALLQAARVAHQMRHADAYGIGPSEPRVDLAQVMARVQEAVERVYSQESPAKLAEKGIEVLLAPARFIGPDTIEAGGRRVKAARFLVCTGAVPSRPPIPGLEQTPHLTYLDVFALTSMPERLIVLGGGATGCELAQALARLGARVTLVEALDRLLPQAEPETGAVLREQFESEGIAVHTGAAVSRFSSGEGKVTASLTAGELEADALLVATGRRPRLEGLDLDLAGVEFDSTGIKVDEHLRTTQSHIYAAGDVTGGFQFTHYAGWQGFYAARNALLPGASKAVRDHVPWAVFTDPEVGRVGWTRAQAEGEGGLEVHRWPLERLDRAQTMGERHGYLEVLTRGGSIVGGTAVAGAASELVNELAVAMEHGIKLRDLGPVIHAYPTYGFGIQQMAAEIAMAQALGGISGRIVRRLLR
jgi:pyruvate/2-oxoglutarate dehydrogenase complex dihydrolipoamide dehydrogenase (E3) component